METDRREIKATDGTSMVYFVTGNPAGLPVILMHGWGCDHTTVRSIAAALESDYLIYNVDFPGFGESPEPIQVWGVEEYTALIEKMIAEEHITFPALIGHSFGGRIAILAASRPGADYSRIVLVDAAGIKPKRTLKYYWKVYTYKLGKRLSRILFGEQRAKRLAEKRIQKKGSSDYANATPRMRAVMSRTVNHDLTDRLHLITAPTLLIWGENDTATPLSDARKMNRLIADSGLVSFPGCGHYSFLDNPVQFRAVLKSFFSS